MYLPYELFSGGGGGKKDRCAINVNREVAQLLELRATELCEKIKNRKKNGEIKVLLSSRHAVANRRSRSPSLASTSIKARWRRFLRLSDA